MPEFVHLYNFSGLYICILLLLYNVFTSNNNYIQLLLYKLSLYNSISCIIIVNIIGLYLFLKNINFEINIHLNVAYKK